MSRWTQRHGCCLQCSIVKLQQAIKPGAARPVKGAFEWLERCEVKVSRTVLRGLGGSNAPWLPDEPTSLGSQALPAVGLPALRWRLNRRAADAVVRLPLR